MPIHKILYPILGTVSVGATATAVAVPLVVKKKAEDIMGKFVPMNGARPNLASKEKINYVALGDSISAGYNGFLGRDFVSFADFLANDIKNHNRLGFYKNFSSSGDTIWSLYNKVVLNPSTLHGIADADLVTITIGSNDLLTMVKALELTFSTIMGGGENKDPSTNALREVIDANVNEGVTFAETLHLISESITSMYDAFKNDDFSGFISLQEGMRGKIYDIIKRNLMILIHDIHSAAPNALINVFSPYLPFENMPDSLINGPIEANGGTTLAKEYGKLIESIKAGTNNAKYTSFYDLGSLEEWKNEIQNKTFHPFDDGDATTTLPEEAYATSRVLPNIADIHPSTYGHEVLGNALFKILAKDQLNIEVNDEKLTHGRVANRNDIAESFDENTPEVFSPEYYDETNKPGVDRGLAKAISSIFAAAKPKDTTLINALLDQVKTLIPSLLGGSSSTLYKLGADSIEEVIPASTIADGGLLAKLSLTDIVSGTDSRFNIVFNKLLALINGVDNKHLGDAKEIIKSMLGLKDPGTTALSDTSGIEDTNVPYQDVLHSTQTWQSILTEIRGLNYAGATFVGNQKVIYSQDGSRHLDVTKYGAKDFGDLVFRGGFCSQFGLLYMAISGIQSWYDVNTGYDLSDSDANGNPIYDIQTVEEAMKARWGTGFTKTFAINALNGDFKEIDSVAHILDLNLDNLHTEFQSINDKVNTLTSSIDNIKEITDLFYKTDGRKDIDSFKGWYDQLSNNPIKQAIESDTHEIVAGKTVKDLFYDGLNNKWFNISQFPLLNGVADYDATGFFKYAIERTIMITGIKTSTKANAEIKLPTIETLFTQLSSSVNKLFSILGLA